MRGGPDFCYTCGKIRHSERNCPNSSLGGTGQQDNQFGPWMRAGGGKLSPPKERKGRQPVNTSPNKQRWGFKEGELVPKPSDKELSERGQAAEEGNTSTVCGQTVGIVQANEISPNKKRWGFKDGELVPKFSETGLRERNQAAEEEHGQTADVNQVNDKDDKAKQAQLQSEMRLCGGQLNVVLEKSVEQSSKEVECSGEHASGGSIRGWGGNVQPQKIYMHKKQVEYSTDNQEITRRESETKAKQTSHREKESTAAG